MNIQTLEENNPKMAMNWVVALILGMQLWSGCTQRDTQKFHTQADLNLQDIRLVRVPGTTPLFLLISRDLD